MINVNLLTTQELKDLLEDIEQELDARAESKMREYETSLRNTIDEALEFGFIVEINSEDEEGPARLMLTNHRYCISVH